MSDMTKLDDEVRVIAEFGDVSDGTSYVEHGMAREILRLRRILAALQEPSESIMHTAYLASFQHALFERAWTATLCAAVAAAEQEVGRE